MISKKQKVISILSFLFAFLFLFSSVMPLYAATAEYNAPDVKEYSLSCSQAYLSFGTIIKGKDVFYYPVTITNKSSTEVNLIYFFSQDNAVFKADFPASLELLAGESMTVNITVNSNAPTGNYSSQLWIYDESDPQNWYGVSLPMSVTIINESSYVDRVTVFPSQISVAKGSDYSFYATVTGSAGANRDVFWSVSGNSTPMTYIDEQGILHVDENEASSYLTVEASSVQDPSVYGTAGVSLTTNSHTVFLQMNPQNGGSVYGGGSVVHGHDVTITAVPNNGFEFVNWTDSNHQVVCTNPQHTLENVRSDVSLTANFQQKSCYIKIRSNYDAAGSITGSQSIGYGGSINLVAKPNNGYQFDCWKEGDNVISRDASCVINNITSDKTYTAFFSQTQFDVSISVSPQDTGYTAGAATYKAGSNVVLKATPYQGYHFVNWTNNGKEIGTDAALEIKNLQSDLHLVANFAKNNAPVYSITASVTDSNGTISPMGTSSVAKGGNIIYTITPKSGYVISTVKVDNTSVGAVASYAFANVDGNHTIVASFAPAPVPTPRPTPKPTAAPTPEPTAKSDETPIPSSQPATPPEESEFPIQPKEDIIPDDPVTAEDYDELTGVFQLLNITPSEALEAIFSGQDRVLMNLASQEGYLNITVHNEYANMAQETIGNQLENITSIPNMSEVLNSILTPDDKMLAFKGENVSVNLSIFNNNDLQTEDDKKIKRIAAKENFEIGDFFEIVLMKTTQGSTQMVTELDTPMTVVMNIPQNLKADGRAYCIMRAHQMSDGSIDISFLADTDSDPNTVTFQTDRFSSYALVYRGGSSGIDTVMIIKILILVLLGIIFSTIALSFIGVKRKRKKRS